MPINDPIDHLPTAPVTGPRLPSKTPLVVKHLAETWWNKYRAEGGLDKAPALPGKSFRLSSVSMRCDRQLWYSMLSVPETEPTTMAGAWRMGLGTMIHNELQDVMLAMPGGWRPEVLVDMTSIGIDGSGHADLVQFLCIHCSSPIRMESNEGDERWDDPSILYAICDEECDASASFQVRKVDEGHGNFHYTHDPEHERAEICVELKTQGGFGFKMKATNFKGNAEGPQHDHVMQGALAARVLGAPKLIVAYLSMENVSADLAAAYSVDEFGTFAAEWKFLVADLDLLIDAEIARIKRLIRAAQANVLPARELSDPTVPVGAVVFNPRATPTNGAWQLLGADGHVAQAGQKWYCGYCRHRTRCINDGAIDTATSTDVF
jgi:hypothetical protein